MSAVISPCGLYRYRLDRCIYNWPLGKRTRACVVMVNPSTADAERNDATIRKLLGFGQRLRWHDLIVVNKFAFRATDVKALHDTPDPVGPLNSGYMLAAMIEADVIVVAWGSLNKLPPVLRGRWKKVRQIATALGKPLYCWGTCDDGHPCHPVMLGYDTPLTSWEPPK